MKLEDYKARVEKSPENKLFQFSYGQALFRAGDYSTAITPLEFCCKEDPNWMHARALLGEAYMHLNDKEKSKQELKEAKRLGIEQNHPSAVEKMEILLDELN